MSVQEDEELRERLDALLGAIDPPPAPVALAMRRGKAIRMRRWGATAVGLAVLAGGAAALPAVLHTTWSAPRPTAPVDYTLTVHGPGKHAPGGLIAYGTQDGNRWKVVISGRGANEAASGAGASRISFGSPKGTDSGLVAFQAASGGGVNGGTTLAGSVASDVTKVSLTLPGGHVLALRPVSYLAQRFVAIVIPAGVPIVRAVAYDGRRELAYSIPYEQVIPINWWRPGQVGPARFTKTIASGTSEGRAWRYVAQFGPWGFCYATPGGNDCFAGTRPTGTSAPGTTVTMMSCGALGGESPRSPTSVLASAPADARLVVLRFSGGSSDHVQAVDVEGVRMLGYIIPGGQRVVRASVYDAAGRMVHSSSAASLSCGD